MKYPQISALLGLKSASEALTDAHMTAAEDSLVALQSRESSAQAQVTELTGKLETAQADLAAATEAKGKVDAELTGVKATVETLEKWKREQAVVDGRTSDESNKSDGESTPKAAFESEADAVVARVKANLGLA